MSGAQTGREQAPGAATEDAGGGLLDQAIAATQQTPEETTKDLLRALTEEALEGEVTFNKNLLVTINNAIDRIDEKISHQLNQIMHHEKFQDLEASWHGLRYLVKNTESGPNLKIRVLNASKRELHRDLSRATEFDQSTTFKAIYENEFGMPGGEPYGALIGDFQFSHHPEDMEVLREMSHVAAAAHAPFITSAGPKLFGMTDFTELPKPRDLTKIFQAEEYGKWRAFRESDDARYVVMTLPNMLARVPYGQASSPVEAFQYEEAPLDDKGNQRALAHDGYCWSNSAYALGQRLTEAFALNGWCTAIRGAEGGGKVEDLPVHQYTGDDGEVKQMGPTEVGITDRRENELSRLGFLALSHYKKTDYAVFFGAQTLHKPPKYDSDAANENAAISARLPYIMASSRFAHYLKVMGRDKVGSFMEAKNCEKWLNEWIQTYVNANDEAGEEIKAQYPLREAVVTVREVPGQPGSYHAVAHLRPWLQMEELTASLRMVASIPQSGT